MIFQEALYQSLFGLAFALWIISTAFVTRMYIITLFHKGWGYPFIVASAWIGATSIAESALFLLTVLWALESHDTFRTAVLYYIPIALSIRAIAFLFIGTWIMHSGDNAL